LNFGRFSAIEFPVLLELAEETPRATFRRQLSVLLEAIVERAVANDEDERELEAARFDDLEQVVDARRNGTLLPTCDE
jgi:hypothetical protein